MKTAGTFEWLNKQGVRSSEGYTFQSMHRFYYHYVEGDRKLQINVEPFTDDKGRYSEGVYLDSLKHWLPPHDNEPISLEKQKEIQERISAALKFMNINHSFT
jgi:hypothetical protein